jgi:hypothetical protein
MNQTRLQELFSYDAETGRLSHRTNTNKRRAGDLAGWFHAASGYRQISADCKQYQEHRVIWMLVHGSWPVACIDHINGVRDDNRLCNLRSASKRLNAENKRSARADSACGVMGVREVKPGRWEARIWQRGKSVCLGTHPAMNVAHDAYLSAKRRLHEGCTI